MKLHERSHYPYNHQADCNHPMGRGSPWWRSNFLHTSSNRIIGWIIVTSCPSTSQAQYRTWSIPSDQIYQILPMSPRSPSTRLYVRLYVSTSHSLAALGRVGSNNEDKKDLNIDLSLGHETGRINWDSPKNKHN